LGFTIDRGYDVGYGGGGRVDVKEGADVSGNMVMCMPVRDTESVKNIYSYLMKRTLYQIGRADSMAGWYLSIHLEVLQMDLLN
jgi:hypothetical protein